MRCENFVLALAAFAALVLLPTTSSRSSTMARHSRIRHRQTSRLSCVIREE